MTLRSISESIQTVLPGVIVTQNFEFCVLYLFRHLTARHGWGTTGPCVAKDDKDMITSRFLTPALRRQQLLCLLPFPAMNTCQQTKVNHTEEQSTWLSLSPPQMAVRVTVLGRDWLGHVDKAEGTNFREKRGCSLLEREQLFWPAVSLQNSREMWITLST